MACMVDGISRHPHFCKPIPMVFKTVNRYDFLDDINFITQKFFLGKVFQTEVVERRQDLLNVRLKINSKQMIKLFMGFDLAQP